MPYNYYTKITREDALAIRAYLASLPPVRNDVRSNQLPFPLSIRKFVLGWNALYFKQGRFQPTAGKSDEWNRGAYLVQGLGHCGMCHTDKTAFGGDTGTPLAGGELVGSYAPNLNSDLRTGLGNWSIDDIIAYLRAGNNSRASATGQMAEVVNDSTSHLSDSDVRAIAAYLKDLPQVNAQEAAQAVNADDPAMHAGERVYVDNCAACHSKDGSGAPRMFIPLRGSSIAQQPSALDMIHAVLDGTKNASTDAAPTGPAMPAFGWKLTDSEIATALTYVRNSWGNRAPAVSVDDVRSQRTAANR
jgi:mono/diheme cytochrome c family protein